MNNSAIQTTFNKRVNKSNHLSNLLNCNYLRGNEIFRSYFRMLWRRRLGGVGGQQQRWRQWCLCPAPGCSVAALDAQAYR